MKCRSPKRQSSIRSLTKNMAAHMRARLCIHPISYSARAKWQSIASRTLGCTLAHGGIDNWIARLPFFPCLQSLSVYIFLPEHVGVFLLKRSAHADARICGHDVLATPVIVPSAQRRAPELTI